MSELVEGFEGLSNIRNAVSFFGSKRIEPSHPYYKLAYKTAKLFAKNGYSIMTGAGQGIMEASNRGVCDAKTKTKSIGLNILIPEQQSANSYVKYLLEFKYFFVRKVMFTKYSRAFVVFPGGYGTLDEFFEALALVQTNRIKPFPIILVNKQYWEGLVDWLKSTLIKEGALIKEELFLFQMVDTPQEALKAAKRIWKYKNK